MQVASTVVNSVGDVLNRGLGLTAVGTEAKASSQDVHRCVRLTLHEFDKMGILRHASMDETKTLSPDSLCKVLASVPAKLNQWRLHNSEDAKLIQDQQHEIDVLRAEISHAAEAADDTDTTRLVAALKSQKQEIAVLRSYHAQVLSLKAEVAALRLHASDLAESHLESAHAGDDGELAHLDTIHEESPDLVSLRRELDRERAHNKELGRILQESRDAMRSAMSRRSAGASGGDYRRQLDAQARELDRQSNTIELLKTELRNSNAACIDSYAKIKVLLTKYRSCKQKAIAFSTQANAWYRMLRYAYADLEVVSSLLGPWKTSIDPDEAPPGCERNRQSPDDVAYQYHCTSVWDLVNKLTKTFEDIDVEAKQYTSKFPELVTPLRNVTTQCKQGLLKYAFRLMGACGIEGKRCQGIIAAILESVRNSNVHFSYGSEEEEQWAKSQSLNVLASFPLALHRIKNELDRRVTIHFVTAKHKAVNEARRAAVRTGVFLSEEFELNADSSVVASVSKVDSKISDRCLKALHAFDQIFPDVMSVHTAQFTKPSFIAFSKLMRLSLCAHAIHNALLRGGNVFGAAWWFLPDVEPCSVAMDHLHTFVVNHAWEGHKWSKDDTVPPASVDAFCALATLHSITGPINPETIATLRTTTTLQPEASAESIKGIEARFCGIVDPFTLDLAPRQVRVSPWLYNFRVAHCTRGRWHGIEGGFTDLGFRPMDTAKLASLCCDMSQKIICRYGFEEGSFDIRQHTGWIYLILRMMQLWFHRHPIASSTSNTVSTVIERVLSDGHLLEIGREYVDVESVRGDLSDVSPLLTVYEMLDSALTTEFDSSTLMGTGRGARVGGGAGGLYPPITQTLTVPFGNSTLVLQAGSPLASIASSQMTTSLDPRLDRYFASISYSTFHKMMALMHSYESLKAQTVEMVCLSTGGLESAVSFFRRFGSEVARVDESRHGLDVALDTRMGKAGTIFESKKQIKKCVTISSIDVLIPYVRGPLGTDFSSVLSNPSQFPQDRLVLVLVIGDEKHPETFSSAFSSFLDNRHVRRAILEFHTHLRVVASTPSFSAELSVPADLDPFVSKEPIGADVSPHGLAQMALVCRLLSQTPDPRLGMDWTVEESTGYLERMVADVCGGYNAAVVERAHMV